MGGCAPGVAPPNGAVLVVVPGVAPPNGAVLVVVPGVAPVSVPVSVLVVVPGVAPPNGAVPVSARYNSYNRFNIIRIPEIYKGRRIAGPASRKELKENTDFHARPPPEKNLKSNVILHHLFKRLYPLIHHIRCPRAYYRCFICPIKQFRPS